MSAVLKFVKSMRPFFFSSALPFVTFRHKYSASYFPPVNNALLNMDICPLGEIISMPEGCNLKRWMYYLLVTN